MLYFYIDESGTGLKDNNSPYFILAAFAISSEQWAKVDSQTNALKRQLVSWAKPEDFEIKGRDLRRGEKFFKNMNWRQRLKASQDIADLITTLPCRMFAVQVDKRDLPAYVSSPDDLYRLAFWRLLEMLENELQRTKQAGMLLVDSRSDLHSSVQDRRLIDAYREWIALRNGQTQLVEAPWFGFSAFYVGLQLADFCAYFIDVTANERGRAMQDVFARFRHKVQLIHIP